MTLILHRSGRKMESQNNVLRQLPLCLSESTKWRKILCFWVCDHEGNLSSLDLLKDSRQIYKCRVIFQAQFPRELLEFLGLFFPLCSPHSVRAVLCHEPKWHAPDFGEMGISNVTLRLEGPTFQTDWIPTWHNICQTKWTTDILSLSFCITWRSNFYPERRHCCE